MVKGTSRQVILVHSPDKKLFDQAIFILKDDAHGITDEALLDAVFKINQPTLDEDENVFNVYLNACIVFNLLMIILSFIKIFLEKIIYAISSRKQQNYKSN